MLLPLLLRLPSEHATVSGDVAPPASVTVTVAVAVAVVTEPAAILGCRRAPPGGPGGDVKPKLARAREPPDRRQLAYGAMTAAASDDDPTRTNAHNTPEPVMHDTTQQWCNTVRHRQQLGLGFSYAPSELRSDDTANDDEDRASTERAHHRQTTSTTIAPSSSSSTTTTSIKTRTPTFVRFKQLVHQPKLWLE